MSEDSIVGCSPHRQEQITQYCDRISRELDRFVIALMELEGATSNLVTGSNADADRDSLKSLQSIDYLSQCASAMSEIVYQIPRLKHAELQQLIIGIKPTDLSDRLNERGLDDIDNLSEKTEVF